MVRIAGAVWVFLLLAGVCAGQATTQSIQGLVTDSSGALVAGARVTATEINTGVVRTVTTNETGNYTVPLLPVGNYDVKVEMQGFKTGARPTSASKQRHRSGRISRCEVGNVTETVEVSAIGGHF